jgi:hypothetical protein
MDDADIKDLEQFALDNYEEGGHWVYETYDRNDYIVTLFKADGDVEAAKRHLRQYWELMNEQQKNCW